MLLKASPAMLQCMLENCIRLQRPSHDFCVYVQLVTNTAQALPAEMPAGTSRASRHAQKSRPSRRRGLRALWQQPSSQKLDQA